VPLKPLGFRDELPAESTLDAATLREMLGETSGALLTERAVTKAIEQNQLFCQPWEILTAWRRAVVCRSLGAQQEEQESADRQRFCRT
jgi:hypothetical protein